MKQGISQYLFQDGYQVAYSNGSGSLAAMCLPLSGGSSPWNKIYCLFGVQSIDLRGQLYMVSVTSVAGNESSASPATGQGNTSRPMLQNNPLAHKRQSKSMCLSLFGRICYKCVNLYGRKRPFALVGCSCRSFLNNNGKFCACNYFHLEPLPPENIQLKSLTTTSFSANWTTNRNSAAVCHHYI